MLVKHGANVNACCKKGHTPLMEVAAEGKFRTKLPSIVELLLKNGANPNIRDKNGFSARSLLELNMYFSKKETKAIKAVFKKYGAR